MNYYNEHDAFAAAWLRELMREGAIPAGHVDERDVRDVLPSDLDEYDQCHFFAGIGGWAEALRLAGLSGMRGVWTGSCPCQPFSAAGRGLGFADERHLWPAFFHLIDKCRPPVVLGEQVASKAGLEWLDLVQSDLEGAGYAVGAADLSAASVGAPHIRQRLWWVAYAYGIDRSQEREGHDAIGEQRSAQRGRQQFPSRLGADGGICHGLRGAGSHRFGNHIGLADGIGPRLEGRDARSLGDERATAERGSSAGELKPVVTSGMGDTGREGRRQVCENPGGRGEGSGAQGLVERPLHECTRGHWSDLVWLPCRDGKARPTQPGIQPLAHGVPNRVGTLRGAGNAIIPQVGAEFLRAALDAVARTQ